MYGTRRGSIASIIFNFGAAHELREEIMARLKRVAEESPKLFGEVTVNMLGQGGEAVAELQRPWPDRRFIDSLVRALATEKFTLIFGGVVDEIALEDELLRMIGLAPPEEPSPN